jgi:hypothetical protein
MKRFLLSLAAVVAVVAPALAQSDPNTPPATIYENFGAVFESPSPQIDALAFANYGSFSVSGGAFPYDFQHVLNFTNTGRMNANPGFHFDTAFRDSPRVPAISFFNGTGATITGSTYVEIDATNIVIEGIITAGGDGLIRMKGKSINLTRSGLQIEPLGVDTGFCRPLNLLSPPSIGITNFFPDIGIFDQLWEVHTNALGVDTLITPNSDGTFRVTAPAPVGNLPNATAFVLTNALSPTNLFVQAVFVQTRDTNVSVQTRFALTPGINNPPFRTPIVQMSATESNVVTGQLLRKSIYLVDKLASEIAIAADTNLVLLLNEDTQNTFMPSPYVISRTRPCEFDSGRNANSIPTNNIFYSQSYSNTIVTNIGAGYLANVGRSGTQLPSIPNATRTNVASRIQIEADNLDLSKTRMRADGFVSITSSNLVASSNSVIAVQTMNVDLDSATQKLFVKSLVLETIQLFEGNVAIWSGYWTNQTGLLVTNVVPDMTDPTLSVTNIDTNVVDIIFHALFVDNRMQTEGAVFVNDLTLRSPEVVLSDKLQVLDKLMVLSERFTIAQEGSLFLPGANVPGIGIGGSGSGVKDWAVTNFPNLLYLTNFGSISVANNARFGSDTTNGYISMVNHGDISAASPVIRATEFENSGSISSDGPIGLTATVAKLDTGQFAANGDVSITGGDVKFNSHSIRTSGTLILSVTGSLTDSGGEANNIWSVENGFRLPIKPATGDLLGTSLSTTAPRFGNVLHTWSAEDRGATVAGFSNNAAIGRLVLDGGPDSLLTFSAVTDSNALYADFLQVEPSVANDLANTLQINPGLVIYFADSNLPVEQLDGQFDGRLRWVRDFVGPNSGVDVLLRSGKTVLANRAVRNSAAIDSDNDGIANRDDLYPFDPDTVPLSNVSIVSRAPLVASVSLEGTSQKVYVLEYTGDLLAPKWQVHSTYKNEAPTSGIFTLPIHDPLPAGEYQRYYRVRLRPQ